MVLKIKVASNKANKVKVRHLSSDLVIKELKKLLIEERNATLIMADERDALIAMLVEGTEILKAQKQKIKIDLFFIILSALTIGVLLGIIFI